MKRVTLIIFRCLLIVLTLHKKQSFPISISSVNVTKFIGNCDLVTFTEEILNGKRIIAAIT